MCGVVVVRVMAGLALAWGLGCGRGDPATAGIRNAAEGPVIARIGAETITLQDLKVRLDREPSFVQLRYSSYEKQKELLENLVRFEVLAKEAERRGLARDPFVVRAAKEELVARLTREQFEARHRPERISDDEVRSYLERHKSDFDEVRVSQILLLDGAEAARLAAEARAARKDDAAAFRALVEAHSQDEDSKPRGGDLTYFGRDTTSHPAAVVEAAFALGELHAVSEPIQTEQGFHVLKLTGRRSGAARPLDEVRRAIQQRIHSERRRQQLDRWVEEMRQRLKVEVYEDKLRALRTGSPPAAAGARSRPSSPGASP